MISFNKGEFISTCDECYATGKNVTVLNIDGKDYCEECYKDYCNERANESHDLICEECGITTYNLYRCENDNTYCEYCFDDMTKERYSKSLMNFKRLRRTISEPLITSLSRTCRLKRDKAEITAFGSLKHKATKDEVEEYKFYKNIEFLLNMLGGSFDVR